MTPEEAFNRLRQQSESMKAVGFSAEQMAHALRRFQELAERTSMVIVYRTEVEAKRAMRRIRNGESK